MKLSELVATIIVAVFMIVLTLFVGFIPLMVVYINNIPELDFFARIVGCLTAIPMLRLTLSAIDWVSDLKYWRD